MTPSVRRPWRALILENVLWLIGSVLLSLFVWYAANSQQNPVLQQRYPGRVTVQILKDETLLITAAPAPAQVVIRAPRSVWDILDVNDIAVVADLRGKGPGLYTVPLTASLSATRLGTVAEIQPSEVTIELVKRTEAIFAITVMPSRPPPVGFEVSKTQLSEASAKVSGSEEAIKRVAAVIAPVDLNDQARAFTRTLALVAVDSERRTVGDVTILPKQVEATLSIDPRPGVTVLKVSANLQNSTLPFGYRLNNYSVEPSVVAVRGDRGIIDGLNGLLNTDPISLTNKVGPFTQTVRLALPDGVSLTDPVNVVVSVEIEAVPSTREFVNIPIQTQGLDPADFQITLQPMTVNVIVKGPLQAVDTLDVKEITVIAPLAGLGGGTQTVILQATVAHAGLTSSNLSIPNPEIRVTILALRPTPTGTATRIPTATLPATVTATATPN